RNEKDAKARESKRKAMRPTVSGTVSGPCSGMVCRRSTSESERNCANTAGDRGLIWLALAMGTFLLVSAVIRAYRQSHSQVFTLGRSSTHVAPIRPAAPHVHPSNFHGVPRGSRADLDQRGRRQLGRRRR